MSSKFQGFKHKQCVTRKGIPSHSLVQEFMWCEQANMQPVVFNMASSESRANRLMKAFNSARGANILDEGNPEEIQALVHKYFTAPDADDAAENSDEEDSEDDNNERRDGCTAFDFERDGSEHDDSDSADENLVDASAPNVNIDIQDCAVLNPDSEMLKVQNLDCKCKLKTADSKTESSSTSSRSSTVRQQACVSQFPDEEILARRLNLS